MQLQERVRQAVELPVNKVDRINLLNLYQEVFLLRKDPNCPGCVIAAYDELKSWLQNKNGIDMEAKINLITCEYVPADPERRKEIEFCLERNRTSGLFNEVITVSHQPTFDELFAIAAKYPNDINVIANTDIFFDETIKQARKIGDREAFALTRWDFKGNNKFDFFNRQDSQDVWIIKGGPRKELKAAFQMGKPGCLSGDTLINYKRGKRKGGRKVSLSDMYARFNNIEEAGYKWGDETETFVQSLNIETGAIFYNRVLSVIQSGVKNTIKLTLEGEISLILTHDHPVLMGDKSYTEAGHLNIGDAVTCLGSMKPTPSGKKRTFQKRKEVYVKYHPNANKTIVRGHTYYKIRKAIVVAEASLNDMDYDDFFYALNNNALKSSTFKFIERGMEVHHKDENALNDDPDNLIVLSKSDHAKLHSKIENMHIDYLSIKKVVRIETWEDIMTYDISMESPHNNFSANGVIVHNCDNRLAYELKEAGYYLRNPSHSIRTYHYHLSGVHTYNPQNRVSEPYVFIGGHAL